MPFYAFTCNTCGREAEVMRPMAQASDPGPRCCETPMRRLFLSHYHCDEVRGSAYFCPDRRREVKDHGKVYDLGLGKWYTTKSERRKYIKQAGFQEHGIREV